MKIKEIEFKNHPILGNVNFNFCDNDGEICDTIVLAGDNGCGKTTLLKSIAELQVGTNFLSAKEERTYIVQLSTDKAKELADLIGDELVRKGWGRPAPYIKDNELILEFSQRPPPHKKHHNAYFEGRNRKKKAIPDTLYQLGNYQQMFQSLFMTAEVSFIVDSNNEPKNSVLDSTIGHHTTTDKMGIDINSLLIGIYEEDSLEQRNWEDAHNQKPAPDKMKGWRTKRFAAAFEKFMPNRKYLGFTKLHPNDSIRQILFETYGQKVPISHLSSGEKQIVFRGAQILRHQKTFIEQGAIVCIDEPELSLHPDWQDRILHFYKDLIQDGQEQKSQLFIATHSPQIIHSTVDEKVIVMSRDKKNHQLYQEKKPSFSRMSTDEIIGQAFNYTKAFLGTSKQKIVLVEGETDQIILETAWKKLYPRRKAQFEIVNALCASHIRLLLSREEIFHRNPDKFFFGLFDFDTAYNEWKTLEKKRLGWKRSRNAERSGLTLNHPQKNGTAFLLPVPSTRTDIASDALGAASSLSVELLFEDNKIDPANIQNIGTRKVFCGDKKRFANHVKSFQPHDFKYFIPIFEKITNKRLQAEK